MSAGLQAPLPDIQPGTLQHLELLHLASNMLSTLPASWGSRQDVLPSLQELYINMHISGPLPAAWSAGFQKLETLTIRQPGIRNQSSWAANGDGRWDQVRDSQSHAASAAVPELTDTSRVAASPSQRHLPPEWSTGFPVALVILLDNLNISGTFPTSWSTTGFPALARLSLQNNQLSGPLPSQLLASHKHLASINVSAVLFAQSLLVAPTDASMQPTFPAAGLQFVHWNTTVGLGRPNGEGSCTSKSDVQMTCQ